jgi:hypothetical protein
VYKLKPHLRVVVVIGVGEQEGDPSCIANEDGERQIACAVSYNGEEVVGFAVLFLYLTVRLLNLQSTILK